MEDQIKLQKAFAQFAEALIGMNDDILRDVLMYDINIRITKLDGESYMIGNDYRKNRINVEIANEKIIHAYVG